MSRDLTADSEPYKITVTVRMMDGTARTYLVNRSKSVTRLWKALMKMFPEANGSEAGGNR